MLFRGLAWAQRLAKESQLLPDFKAKAGQELVGQGMQIESLSTEKGRGSVEKRGAEGILRTWKGKEKVTEKRKMKRSEIRGSAALCLPGPARRDSR
jgi:hypothetical protein